MYKNLVYLSFDNNKLQVFFAALAFVEKYNKDRVFLCDDKNIQILSECEKYIKFKKLNKTNTLVDFEVVNISIDHSKPYTEIFTYHSAPLIFPKLISSKFRTKFETKIEKIYFRGLLTKNRIKESLFLLLSIRDFKAIGILFLNLIKTNSDFTVNTTKVFIKFTKRGRQSKFKYLDDDYYSEMSKFKYIFCPKGDFIWTYRFFEAIQLGCIPLSKHSTVNYSSFFYLRKIDDVIVGQNDKINNNNLVFERVYNL